MTTTVRAFVFCPGCGKDVQLRHSGRFPSHKGHGVLCPWSGRVPRQGTTRTCDQCDAHAATDPAGDLPVYLETFHARNHPVPWRPLIEEVP